MADRPAPDLPEIAGSLAAAARRGAGSGRRAGADRRRGRGAPAPARRWAAPAAARRSPMIEHLLHGSPVSTAGIDSGRAMRWARSRQRWPRSRPLRVLELGADGGTTRAAARSVWRKPTWRSPTWRRAPTRSRWPGSLPLADSFAGVSAGHWSPRRRRPTASTARRSTSSSRSRLRPAAARPPGAGRLARAAGAGRGVGRRRARAEPALGRRLRPDAPVVAAAAAEVRRCAPARSGVPSWPSPGSAAAAAPELPAVPWPIAIFWGSAAAGPQPAACRSARSRPRWLIVGRDRVSAARSKIGWPRPATPCGPCRVGERGVSRKRVGGTAREVVLFLGGANDAAGCCRSSRPSRSPRSLAMPRQRRNAVPLVGGHAAMRSRRRWRKRRLIGAALWGFGRVLLNEMPRLSLRLLDLCRTACAGRARRRRSPPNWPPTAPRPRSSGPRRDAMSCACARGLPPRWATPADALALDGRASRAGSTPWAGSRAAPRRPGPARSRSTCMPPGSISAT